MIVRTSDHGELGLSHGGLRQKMFNAYEETIRVPLVVSNPVLFPEARESDALVSLVDSSRRSSAWPALRRARAGSTGTTSGRCCAGRRIGVREAVLFTYDDHQAATAFQEAPGQPNRIRCVRDRRWKYAVYLDPTGDVAPEYELYDLESDPDEALNLVDKRTGRGRTAQAERERIRMHAVLEQLCRETGTTEPPLPPAEPAAG